MGELTAPKSAPWHSLRRVSTVLGGRAAPVDWKAAQPAGRVVKVREKLKAGARVSRMRRPAWGETVSELEGTQIEGWLWKGRREKAYRYYFAADTISGYQAYVESFGGHCELRSWNILEDWSKFRGRAQSARQITDVGR